MGWFADSMRLRDVIHVVSTIEIPLPDASDAEGGDGIQQSDGDAGPLAA